MELRNCSSTKQLSCFFCLRSNSKMKYLYPQDENGVEETASTFHEISLRNLYRFLNLLHSDKEENDFKNLKMPICEDCFRLNVEFNKLYNLLVETKLRLNWSIMKLQDVIIRARNESRLSSSFQVEPMVEEDVNEEKILEIWRTHTLDRMKDYLTRTSFPRVLIHESPSPSSRKRSHSALMILSDELVIGEEETMRTGRDEQGMPLTLTKETIGQENTLEPLSSSSLLMLDRHDFGENEVGVDADCGHDDACQPSPSGSGNQVLDDNDDAVGTQSDCATEVVEPRREGSSFQERVKRKSHLRARGRPAFISNFVPVVSCDSDNDNTSKLCCKLCKTTLVRSSAFEHWKHHCPKGLQRPLISTESNSKRSTKCSYCSFVCSADIRGQEFSMVKHQVRFHPEHYLLDDGEMDEASGFKPERFRQILTDVVFPKFERNGGNYTACSLCGMKYKSSAYQNMTNVRHHLVLHHKTELKRELNENEGISIKDIPADMKSRKRRAPRAKYSIDCPYCPYKCTSPAGTPSAAGSMVGHLVRFHPEHYLLEEKDKAEGLWHEQFRTILTNMIYPEFILNEGHHTKCSSCGAMYKSSNAAVNVLHLKRHLIFHHKTELKEKFKLLLDDPSFEERFKSHTGGKFSFECPYCEFKCGASGYNVRNTVVKHIVQFHPEHFLLDENERDQVTTGFKPQQFQTIFTNLVLPKFVEITGKDTSCSLCKMKYECNVLPLNVLSVRKHLIFVHKAVLKEELGVIMQDPSLEEKLKTKSITLGKGGTHSVPSTLKDIPSRKARVRKPKYSSKCTHCRFQCSTPNLAMSMERHLVRFHPEHFLLVQGEEKPNELKHPEFQRILTEMIFSKFVFATGQHAKCSLCKMKFTGGKRHDNIMSARKHLMLEHKTELKESIKNVFEDPKLEEKLASSNANGVTCSCGVYIEGRAPTYHENFHCIHKSKMNGSQEKVHRTRRNFEERNSDVEVGESK